MCVKLSIFMTNINPTWIIKFGQYINKITYITSLGVILRNNDFKFQKLSKTKS